MAEGKADLAVGAARVGPELERPTRAEIVRLFDEDRVARLDEEPGRQIEGLRNASDDHDLARLRRLEVDGREELRRVARRAADLAAERAAIAHELAVAQEKWPAFSPEEFQMGRGGFEPPKAEPSDLQSDPFDRSGIDP